MLESLLDFSASLAYRSASAHPQATLPRRSGMVSSVALSAYEEEGVGLFTGDSDLGEEKQKFHAVCPWWQCWDQLGLLFLV